MSRMLAAVLPLLVVALTGCGSNSTAILAAPEQLTLYSINGERPPELEEPPKDVETFHSYPVLGKVEVTDPARRQEIIRALREGLAPKDTPMARCFFPRHGVRAVEKDRTVDYIICFECSRIQIHENGQLKTIPTTGSPRAVLNRSLKEAGIPLTPGAEGERRSEPTPEGASR
jgi:hypothetical protein